MDIPTLTPEQAAGAERLLQLLLPTVVAEGRRIARLSAPEPDGQPPGTTEFAVRDRVPRIGAQALEADLNARKTGGTTGPV